MSNHYHLVVKMAVCGDAKNGLHARWSSVGIWDISKGNAISQRFLGDTDVLDDAEIKALEKHYRPLARAFSGWRWYMRVLNERSAREANRGRPHDTGRFWQGRYESQAPRQARRQRRTRRQRLISDYKTGACRGLAKHPKRACTTSD